MLQLPPPLTLQSLPSHMIPIQGGIFQRGSGDSTHSVQLDDFEICRYPVSQQLWCEVMGKNPERLKFENPHRPVERISWDDIQEDFLPTTERKNPRP